MATSAPPPIRVRTARVWVDRLPTGTTGTSAPPTPAIPPPVACTATDTTASGACVRAQPPHCDAGNVSTADSCVPATGCVHQNVSLPCADGNACTTGDQCSAGQCLGGPPRSCDDGNPCTTDTCS